MQIETVSNHKCQLAEGPVWDARRNAICWIDIEGGEIHEYAFHTHQLRSYALGEKVGCIALCQNGDFIVAKQHGIAFLDRTTGKINEMADPEKDLPNNRFNDGKCDPAGRFWAGTMSISEEPGAGSVYVFDQKTLVRKIQNVTISNGMAWSGDGKTMYYIDTPTHEVVAYDFDNASGNVSGKRVVISIPKEDGYPDGMTIDRDGMLWIAHWDGWQLTRWNPATGEKLYRIKMPVARISSCTFGGDRLRDLFITSARDGLSEYELKDQPLAGSLFVIRNCGFEGVPAIQFNNL